MDSMLDQTQKTSNRLKGERSEAKSECKARTDWSFCDKKKLREPECKARTDWSFCDKKNSGNPSARHEQTGVFVTKKTPVISRSFNHQSKNEQLIRLLLLCISKRRAILEIRGLPQVCFQYLTSRSVF